MNIFALIPKNLIMSCFTDDFIIFFKKLKINSTTDWYHRNRNL